MTAFDIIKRLVAAHGQIQVAVADSEGGAVPKNCIHRGHMELSRESERVIEFREYYPERWQYPPAQLHGEPLSVWVDYVQQHAPGVPLISQYPWAFEGQYEEPRNIILLKDLLQSAPHLFDAVPGLRSEAENFLVLEELS